MILVYPGESYTGVHCWTWVEMTTQSLQHTPRVLKTQTASTSLSRSSSHRNINCSAPLLCISYGSWLTELQRGQRSMGQWEAKHQSDSLIMSTSRRQESGSHSVTAVFFYLRIPLLLPTFLELSILDLQETETPLQAVPSPAPGLRHIFISSCIPGASSSAHRLHYPIDSLQTKGELLPPAHWHGLWAICFHLESLPDGQELVLKHYFTLT